MKQVILDSIYLHNFKSFIEPTTIKLSKQPGLKYLGGRNLVEPRLGSNGAGKSTVWDGICWCLHGTGVRGQKASELSTWNGEGKPHVRVGLHIADRSHQIDRYGSPNRLLIDGRASTQEDVDRLIGLCRDRFLQSVLFGQDSPLFLDMSSAARSELLDDVLGLDRWVAASEAAGHQATILGQSIARLERELSFAEGKLAGIEDEAALQQRADDWQAMHEGELDRIIEQVATAEAQSRELMQKTEAANNELTDCTDPAVLDEQIEEAKVRLRHAQQLQKSIELYERDQCPTCLRPFKDHFARDQITDLRDELIICGNSKELQKIIDVLTEERAVLVTGQQILRHHQSELKIKLASNQNFIDMLEQQAMRTGEQQNVYDSRLNEIRRVKAETIGSITALTEELNTCKGNLLHAEYWKTAFKKVRLFQVKQVLLRLEIETANAANALGIGHWDIRYVTETETKAGTLKHGIQVLVNDRHWEGCSGGETQRIRLAVTLGMAAMIQNMAGVTYGFEILDEPSQYLSVEGIEDLLSCLQARAEITDKSIFVCDHNNLNFNFDEQWMVTKDTGGSRVEILAQSN